MENSCPKCGEELNFDEVDIGVGVMQGNWRCDNCGWTPPTWEEVEKEYAG